MYKNLSQISTIDTNNNNRNIKPRDGLMRSSLEGMSVLHQISGDIVKSIPSALAPGNFFGVSGPRGWIADMYRPCFGGAQLQYTALQNNLPLHNFLCVRDSFAYTHCYYPRTMKPPYIIFFQRSKSREWSTN